MDCHIAYEINKGYKPISLEITGLKKNIDVVITDKEIDRSKCFKKTMEINEICTNYMRFCQIFSNRTSISLLIPECWIKEIFIYFNNKGNSSFSNAKVIYQKVISGFLWFLLKINKKFKKLRFFQLFLDFSCEVASDEEWEFCLNLDSEICSSMNPWQCTKQCNYLFCEDSMKTSRMLKNHEKIDFHNKNARLLSSSRLIGKGICIPSSFKPNQEICSNTSEEYNENGIFFITL